MYYKRILQIVDACLFNFQIELNSLFKRKKYFIFLKIFGMARVMPGKPEQASFQSPIKIKEIPKLPSDFYFCVLVQNIIGSFLCCWALGLIGIYFLVKSERGVQQDKMYRANIIGLSSIFGGIIVVGSIVLLILLLIFWIIPTCDFK